MEISLILGISVLFFLSYYSFNDLFSPSCITCCSFLLAFLCSLLSSNFGDWKLSLGIKSQSCILLGLFCFYSGSIFAKKIKTSVLHDCQKDQQKLNLIYFSRNKLRLILVIQIVILCIFLYFYKKAISQFSGLEWHEMMRAYRFATSYGDGLEENIPSFVNHLTKIPKVNGYISFYILVHNLTVQKFTKTRSSNNKLLLLIVLLYLPLNILNAARFEVVVLICMGIIIWYTIYRRCLIIKKYQYHPHKIIEKITIFVFCCMCFFSIFGQVVGRNASDNLISQSADYFGRNIQAFDLFVEESDKYNSDRFETFFGINKLLKQLQIIEGDVGSIHQDFIEKDGVSLGNTYTSLKRYYSDLSYLGLIVFPFICGFIFTRLYKRTQYIKIGTINFGLICYGSISYCLFLYCYDDYLFSSILSFNYLIIFTLMYMVIKWLTVSKHTKK